MDSEPTRKLDTIPFATKAKVLKHLQESVLHCLKILWLPQQVHGFWWGSRHGMAPGMFTSRILIYLDVAQFQIISCLLKLSQAAGGSSSFCLLLPTSVQQVELKEHCPSSSNSKWWSAGMIATILKPGGVKISRFARNHQVVLIFITHSILLDFGNSIDKNMQWAARTLLVCLLMYWHSFCSCKLFYINWFLIPSPCAHDHISCMPNMLHPSKFAYYGQKMIL